MPLKLKQKQITVQVSELTIELDQTLTQLLTDAAEEAQVEPDAYVLALIQEHLSPETTETASDKPARQKPSNSNPLPKVAAAAVGNPTANATPVKPQTPPRSAKGPKPKYAGKLTELVVFGDEGSDIALELKDKGLITAEQYEAVLNGEIPKGKVGTISQDAQNYIVEQLTKAEAGGAVTDGNAAGNG
jgi:hypothetical protein